MFVRKILQNRLHWIRLMFSIGERGVYMCNLLDKSEFLNISDEITVLVFKFNIYKFSGLCFISLFY